jgi:hypothetical protein
MDARALDKIIWPTSVDMMGQVVVAMTFFFLLMFIVLAYFLKQIELRQRVTIDKQHYQYLYEPVKRYLGVTEIKKKKKELPNIDELILQIQDYILSAPPSRVKDIKSLISKRNQLIDELHQLGYTGYSKINPFSGEYGIMPVLTLELLKQQGDWRTDINGNRLLIRFGDNSVKPNRNSLEQLRANIARFVASINPTDGNKLTLKTYISDRVVVDNLTQRLALHRSILIRNQLRASGLSKEGIRIVSDSSNSKRYPFGAIELSYE